MKKHKTIRVSSKKIVELMLKNGYIINHTCKSVVNPHIKFFYFNFAPGILKDLERFQWEVRNAER